MSTEMLITILAVMGLFVLRFGVPILIMWLASKALRYALAVLP